MIPLKILGFWYALAVEIGVMELLTKGQLSDHIGVTPRTVESWMRDGLLPYIKIRRSVRFDLLDVMRVLKTQHGRNMEPHGASVYRSTNTIAHP